MTLMDVYIKEAIDQFDTLDPSLENVEQTIYDIAESLVPDHAEDRLQLANEDYDLMVDSPTEGTPFDDPLFPSEMLGANIFIRIRDALKEHFENRKDNQNEEV